MLCDCPSKDIQNSPPAVLLNILIYVLSRVVFWEQSSGPMRPHERPAIHFLVPRLAGRFSPSPYAPVVSAYYRRHNNDYYFEQLAYLIDIESVETSPKLVIVTS